MNALEKEISLKKKEFAKNFIFSILGIILFFILLECFLMFTPIAYISDVSLKTLIFTFLGIAYVSFLVSKTEFDFWPIYKIMAISLFILILHFSLLLCHKSIVIFLFYIPIILMTLMLTSLKTAVKCALGIILICFFTPSISTYFNLAQPLPASKEYLKIMHIEEYIIMFFTGGLSFLILYYYNEFNKIEMKHLLLAETKTETGSNKKTEATIPVYEKENQLFEEKIDSLYLEIINHLETEKPYQNPNFNIGMLSKSLNTNSTYVSRALNNKGSKNFMMFINEYRICQVKEDIKNNAYKKFTVEHIYIRAGFSQQSTFNRAFKSLTGMTPSQYIEIQEKE